MKNAAVFGWLFFAVFAANVALAQPPGLPVSATTLDFGQTYVELYLTVYAPYPDGFCWWMVESIPWLTVSPDGDCLYPEDSELVTFTVDRSGLPVGTYSGEINTYTDQGGSGVISVTMEVAEGDPVLAVNPTYLLFPGNWTRIEDHFSIENTGSGWSLEWSITSDQPWLSTDPMSGLGPHEVSVYVDRQGLPAATHYGHLYVASTGGDATVSVEMVVPKRSIVAWGDDWHHQTDTPFPNEDFVAIAAGFYHNLGLKSNGSIVVWGGDVGLWNVPAPNADFVAIAAGTQHSLGLKSNGTIVAWGYNFDGECTVPAPNEDFVAISAGGHFSLGLKSDGTVVAWGANYHGECNVPAPNANFIAIAACGPLGLKADGTVVAWGSSTYVPAPNSEFIAIAAGWFGRKLGLKSDGTVVAWGSSDDVPASNSGFIAIAAGGAHSLALRSDGTIVAWGSNWNDEHMYYSNQCRVPPPNDNFVAIAAGSYHSLGLKHVAATVPVLIEGFEAERGDGGVVLHWTITEGRGLRGFNIYKSLDQGTNFERINEGLVPTNQGNEYVDRSARAGQTCWYRLGAVADDGEWMSQTVSITVPSAALALHQNRPNPFNPTTTISFVLPEKTRVTLAIYDVQGRLVRTLVSETIGEGYQARVWDGRDANGNQVSSGVYFYRLTAGDKTPTKKMVLLK